MKTLEDYSEEINKCSKCGLCQSVCPVYRITGNDCAVSRGKFVMLDGVIKGDLKLNKNINKYLEMCLKCGKCKDFCPSGIDVCEIFKTAKHDYLKNSFEGKIIRFLQSEKIFDTFLEIFSKFNQARTSAISGSEAETLLFFKGCANQIFPSSEKAVKKILNKINIKLIEKNFKCCGVPFASSGNIERFNDVKEYNLNIINNSDGEYLLTDCASCEDALRNYPGINKKVLTIGEYIAEKNIKFKFKKPVRVTFHKPCHLKNDDFVKKILKNCENVQYVEMPDYDSCCGFAGQFAITNRKLSIEISKEKIKQALTVTPDIILTACPACIIGLRQGLISLKGINAKSPKIKNISEFLADGLCE